MCGQVKYKHLGMEVLLMARILYTLSRGYFYVVNLHIYQPVRYCICHITPNGYKHIRCIYIYKLNIKMTNISGTSDVYGDMFSLVLTESSG